MATKILVVEDDGIFASALRTKLKNWGYEVPKTVLTGYEAVKQAENVDPDLVIMNMFLKGKLDGVETAQLIDSEFKTPIIYYSAKNDEQLSKQVKSLQNRDYIPKTCQDERLKLAIESNLKKDNLKINRTKSNGEKSLGENRQKDIKITFDHQNTTKIAPEDKNMNEIKLIKEKNSSLEIKNSHSHAPIKSIDENLKPVTKKNNPDPTISSDSNNLKPAVKKNNLDKNHFSLSSDNNDNIKSSISINGDEYHKTQQKIKHELQNLEIYFSKVSNKMVSQEVEIGKFKEAEEKCISSMQEKDKKIDELEKHQQKLEEKLSIYKKQHEEILNEMYSLKKQIDTFISILEG